MQHPSKPASNDRHKLKKALFGTLLLMLLAVGCFTLAEPAWADPDADTSEESVAITDQELTFVPSNAAGANVRAYADQITFTRTGNYTKWIDRADLPTYAHRFYDLLVEGTDNDGVNDWLIEDRYFSPSLVGEFTASTKIGDVVYYDNNTIGLYLGPVAESGYREDKASLYLLAAFSAFNRDNPQVFWLNFDFTCDMVEINGDRHALFCLKYDGSYQGSWLSYDVRLAAMQNQSLIRTQMNKNRQNMEAILASAPNGSTAQKVAYFNGWLTQHNEYNTYVAQGGSTYNAHWGAATICSALEGRTGTQGPICEGYARAFKVLCNASGIPCVLVDGNAGFNTKSLHMWNYVQMPDGQWYAVDPTWNDGSTVGDPAPVSGSESDSFTLVGSQSVIGGQTFAATHITQNVGLNDQVALPNGPTLSKTSYRELTYPAATKSQLASQNLSLAPTLWPIRADETATLKYAVVEGNLPAGLHLDAVTGKITGSASITTASDVKIGVFENGASTASDVCTMRFSGTGLKSESQQHSATYTNKDQSGIGQTLPAYTSTATATPAGWVKSGNRWWYSYGNGTYMANGWYKVGGAWYYFDAAGWMKTGWVKTGGYWYYLNSSGAMQTGWLKWNGSWYFLSTGGSVPEGAMLAGLVARINGVTYTFNSSGQWVA